MKKQLTILLSTLVLGGSVLFVLPAIHAQPSTTPAPQPATPQRDPVAEMRTALQHLIQARGFLRLAGESKAEFGGHRKAALKACDEAIKEIKDALNAGAEEKH